MRFSFAFSPWILGTLVGLLMSAAFFLDLPYLLLIPVVLGVVYFAFYHTSSLFLSLAFFTPLSINIEEYTNQFGLFIPTEPILFGLMILLLFTQLQNSILPKGITKHPITLLLFAYIAWLLICSIASTHPLISFKSVISRLWYIIPCFLFGPIFFKDIRTIHRFFWLFCIGMCLVICYTVFNHALYGFGEKESHWVMSPFYKDHTIYGAAIALILPLPITLYLLKKQSALNKFILTAMTLIILVGLYFSYTRAAWLSVLGAMLILVLVILRIKFKYVAVLFLVSSYFLINNYDSIQMELARNKTEHTTEAFDERLQSAANVTTDASNLERINRWSCAMAMFKDRPVFGFGPGTYAFEYARFQEPENLTIISTNFGDLGNAHSEYLSALSESGLLGFLIFTAFVSMIFYFQITFIYKAKGIDNASFVMGCGILFSLSTYFIHAFLNNFLDTDKLAIPIFAMLAITFVLHQRLLTQPK